MRLCIFVCVRAISAIVYQETAVGDVDHGEPQPEQAPGGLGVSKDELFE